MKYPNISRKSCCEYSLTEIYDFPEQFVGAIFFEFYAKIYTSKVCFLFIFSAKETLNTFHCYCLIFLFMNCYHFCALQASVLCILVVLIYLHINFRKKFYRGPRWLYCANMEQAYTENMKSNENNGSKCVILDFDFDLYLYKISGVSYCS